MNTADQNRDLASLIAMQSAIVAEAKTIIEENKRLLTAQLAPGERAGSPDTGFCTLSNPTTKAVVVEPEMLEAFLTAEGHARTTTAISDYPAAVDVLRVHAPHLLEDTTEIPGWVVKAAEGRAIAGEDIPGIAVGPGKPTLSTRPTAQTKDRVRELLAGGLLELEEAQ